MGCRRDARSTNLQSYGVRLFPYDADVPLVVLFAEFLVAPDGQDALRVFYNAGRRTCRVQKTKRHKKEKRKKRSIVVEGPQTVAKLKKRELTQIEVKTKEIFFGVERLAVGEADDESEWLSTTQDGRLGLSVHQLVTNGPMLGRVVLGVEVDFVDDQRAFARFGHRRNYRRQNIERDSFRHSTRPLNDTAESVQSAILATSSFDVQSESLKHATKVFFEVKVRHLSLFLNLFFSLFQMLK